MNRIIATKKTLSVLLLTFCTLTIVAFQATKSQKSAVLAVPTCEPVLICGPDSSFVGWPTCGCVPDGGGGGGDGNPLETPAPTPVPTSLAYGAKGIGDAWQNWKPGKPGVNLTALDYDWYYDWSVSYVSQRNNDPKYVRMVYCDGTSGIVSAATQDYNNGIRGRVWLIYNEPDHSNSDTCGAKYVGNPPKQMYKNWEFAARNFSDVYDMIKGADPYARVFGGGVAFLDSQRTRDWWQGFINTLQIEGNLNKLEGVHVHVYPNLSHSTHPPVADTSCHNANQNYCVPKTAQAANDWYTDMHIGLGLGDRPIWITEMGWLYCAKYGGVDNKVWIRDNIMEPLSQWFAKDSAWPYDPQVSLNPGYETVAWYVTHDENVYPCTYLLNSLGSSGTPTVLGQFWNTYQP